MSEWEYWRCSRCGRVHPGERIAIVGRDQNADGEEVIIIHEKTCKCRVVEMPQLPSRFQWR